MDPSERVSLEAQRLEREAIQEYLRSGIMNYLDRKLAQARAYAQVTYDPQRAGYAIALSVVARDGKRLMSRAFVLDEEVTRQSISVSQWMDFLKSLTFELTKGIDKEAKAAGITVTRPAPEPGKWYETGSRGSIGPWLREEAAREAAQHAQERELQKIEEQAAIESIKRSLEEQVQDQ